MEGNEGPMVTELRKNLLRGNLEALTNFTVIAVLILLREEVLAHFSPVERIPIKGGLSWSRPHISSSACTSSQRPDL